MPITKRRQTFIGIMAILFGCFGAHKFLLNYAKEGRIMLCGTLVSIIFIQLYIGLFIWSCIILIGIIEGFTYLMKTTSDFERAYIQNKKSWF